MLGIASNNSVELDRADQQHHDQCWAPYNPDGLIMPDHSIEWSNGDRDTALAIVDDATPVEAAMQADGDEPYTCSIARIIAFSSSRKSRSSYPYKL